ncbi:MAG: Extracellular serine protease, partial [Myxococcaceae bacterium]|nr:Extracellular serine protease [Myxococcaceae bacterium]
VVVDAGIGFPIGAGCLYDLQCQPPSNGLCIPQTVLGTPTGWPGGYCTANCSSVACAAGSSCVNAANANGTPNWLCLKSCAGPRQGQSSCRTNYLCEFDPGNPVGQGICIPRCGSAGFTCWSGTTCSAATGYCVASGPGPVPPP